MIKKNLLLSYFILSVNVLFGQITFNQTNIPVIKNGVELTNPWTGGLNFCQFSEIDLNLDGEKDLFIFDRSGRNGTSNGNKIIPFIFDVTANKYIYAPDYIDLFPTLKDWALLVDYNLDGKMDIFTSDNSAIDVYTNNSDTELSFTYTKKLTSDAGFGPINLYVSSADIPAITDVDLDGDIDILSFDPSGSHVYFHENKSMELYGNSDSVILVRSDNCWGKFAEDFNTNSVILNLTEDCNEATEDGRIGHSGSTLLALDLNPNTNQSMELLLGDLTYNNMLMLQNGGTMNDALIIDQDLNFPSYNEPIDLIKFPGAFHLDLDKDGLKDIIISPNGVNVSENFQNCILYKNTGETINSNIAFEYIETDFLIQEMIDVGSNAKPILYDLNNDEKKDLIIANKGYFNNGNYDSRISLYENIGTNTDPVFKYIDDDFANLSSLGDLNNIQALHPTFGDLDNDNDIDMIIGDNNGELYYFENNGMQGESQWPSFSEYQLLDIDVGSFATPQLIDLNRDGLLDMIIGERMGIDNGVYNGINYYQNIGSLNNPEFENQTPEYPSGEYNINTQEEIITKSLGGIHLGDPTYLTSYTNPHIFEYENQYYLSVGTESGLIYLYSNVETETNGENSPILNLDAEYTLITNNILSRNNCIHSKPAISDINNDGIPDLIRGNASGGLEFFSGEEFDINIPVNIKAGLINIYPNPNNGSFYIENKTGQLSIKIYSIDGELITSQIVTQNTFTFSGLNNGIYLLVATNNTTTKTQKLIINNGY